MKIIAITIALMLSSSFVLADDAPKVVIIKTDQWAINVDCNLAPNQVAQIQTKPYAVREDNLLRVKQGRRVHQCKVLQVEGNVIGETRVAMRD